MSRVSSRGNKGSEIVKCDGKNCSETIGVAGAILYWHGPNANLDYCVKCWDKVKHLWPGEAQ